ncbi:MAG: DUF1566 domain-containing protein [Magnetococcales bacterium]|nr:DUF1566 domain-containing protein [Nitrospirota bacterium]
MINHEVPNQANWLNEQGFVNVQSNSYWSSTSYAYCTSFAWFVYMVDGNVFADVKSNGHMYVWPVRSGHRPFGALVVEANGRFTDNGDGTITDNLTGLEWMKDAGDAARMNWQEAVDYTASLNKKEEAA